MAASGCRRGRSSTACWWTRPEATSAPGDATPTPAGRRRPRTCGTWRRCSRACSIMPPARSSPEGVCFTPPARSPGQKRSRWSPPSALERPISGTQSWPIPFAPTTRPPSACFDRKPPGATGCSSRRGSGRQATCDPVHPQAVGDSNRPRPGTGHLGDAPPASTGRGGRLPGAGRVRYGSGRQARPTGHRHTTTNKPDITS